MISDNVLAALLKARRRGLGLTQRTADRSFLEARRLFAGLNGTKLELEGLEHLSWLGTAFFAK